MTTAGGANTFVPGTAILGKPKRKSLAFVFQRMRAKRFPAKSAKQLQRYSREPQRTYGDALRALFGRGDPQRYAFEFTGPRSGKQRIVSTVGDLPKSVQESGAYREVETDKEKAAKNKTYGRVAKQVKGGKHDVDEHLDRLETHQLRVMGHAENLKARGRAALLDKLHSAAMRRGVEAGHITQEEADARIAKRREAVEAKAKAAADRRGKLREAANMSKANPVSSPPKYSLKDKFTGDAEKAFAVGNRVVFGDGEPVTIKSLRTQVRKGEVPADTHDPRSLESIPTTQKIHSIKATNSFGQTVSHTIYEPRIEHGKTKTQSESLRSAIANARRDAVRPTAKPDFSTHIEAIAKAADHRTAITDAAKKLDAAQFKELGKQMGYTLTGSKKAMVSQLTDVMGSNRVIAARTDDMEKWADSGNPTPKPSGIPKLKAMLAEAAALRTSSPAVTMPTTKPKPVVSPAATSKPSGLPALRDAVAKAQAGRTPSPTVNLPERKATPPAPKPPDADKHAANLAKAETLLKSNRLADRVRGQALKNNTLAAQSIEKEKAERRAARAAKDLPNRPNQSVKTEPETAIAQRDADNQVITGSGNIERNRESPMRRFDTPIVGPSGAKVHSYRWEHTTDRKSDWTAAEKSGHTGRGIVHKFEVEHPNGKRELVSAESALQRLGYIGDQKNPEAAQAMRVFAKHAIEHGQAVSELWNAKASGAAQQTISKLTGLAGNAERRMAKSQAWAAHVASGRKVEDQSLPDGREDLARMRKALSDELAAAIKRKDKAAQDVAMQKLKAIVARQTELQHYSRRSETYGDRIRMVLQRA